MGQVLKPWWPEAPDISEAWSPWCGDVSRHALPAEEKHLSHLLLHLHPQRRPHARTTQT